MQIHFCLCLCIAAATLVTATPQNNNCIVGCKCKEDIAFNRKLKIAECDSPLALTKNALANVSKKISAINLVNNHINKIENDAFDGFSYLETVIIEDSNIGSIDSSAFNLPELGTLKFTRTTFGEVPSLNSSYLEELIFNDCKLSEVPDLKDLPSLGFLSLANNNIKDVDEMVFAKAESLEEVTLSNNSITKLPPNLFSYNGDFNTLNLDYNPLESFELNLISDLEFLSLRFCKLSSFDLSNAKNLKAISSLDLSGNQISVLPIDAFSVMTELNYLDLSNNQLVELDDNIFLENSKLDRVVLDNNHFEKLPNFQTKWKQFQTYHLSCKNCGLKVIDNAFENMQGLVTLDLSNNKIHNVDGVFTKMHGLKQIDLSNNNIISIGVEVFGNNTALETLNLSNNPLTPLDPVVFANIQALITLDVSNSSLVQLWANHNAILPSLEQLLVGKNNLTVITTDDLKVMPKLKLLDLQNNPLECTVEFQDVIQYLIFNTIHPIEGINLLKTHEALISNSGTTDDYNPQESWKQLIADCNMDLVFDDFDSNDFDDDDDDDDDDEDIDEDDETEEDDKYAVDNDILTDELNLNDRNLARASYILSLTSVFILTALVVLTIAVAITLLILKKSKNFSRHNGNLPRLKIPLWNTSSGQKRHSGSIYKPLSEDFSGSRTPIINRYEFKQTPQVHNSIP